MERECKKKKKKNNHPQMPSEKADNIKCVKSTSIRQQGMAPALKGFKLKKTTTKAMLLSIVVYRIINEDSTSPLHPAKQKI